MRFDFHQEPESEELLSVTAMVDVVFILLTFFVLSSTLLGYEQEVAVGAERPAVSGAAAAEDLPQSIAVRLRPGAAEGSVSVTVGQARLGGGGVEAITAKLTEVNLPDVPVVVVAHPDLSVAQVAAAVDAVLKSPSQRISLRRLEEPGP